MNKHTSKGSGERDFDQVKELAKERGWPGLLSTTKPIAKLVWLCKPGKDPNLPTSYRPICIQSVEIRCMMNVVAKRLAHTLPPSPAQFGFA